MENSRSPDVRYDRGRDPIKFQSKLRNHNLGWITGAAAATVMIIICVFAFAYRVDWMMYQ